MTGMDGLKSGSFARISKMVSALVAITGVLSESQDPLVQAQISLMGVVRVIRIFGALKELLAHQTRVSQVLRTPNQRAEGVGPA